MKRYLLDTNSLGAFISRRYGVESHAREVRRAGARIGTCVPVLGEFFYGLELSATRDENLRRARQGLSGLVVWPYDIAAGEEFGRIRAALRRMGRPMQVVDIQLAAVALTLGNCTVVTTDSDLAAIPGLSIEDWTIS